MYISMKKIITLILLTILFTVSSNSIYAKRLLPAARTAAKTTTVSKSKGVTTSVRFRGDRRGILVTFSNVNAFQSISYTLTYTGSGIPQGVSGNITQGEDTVTREIIFGTCSNGICRYDTNIKNAKLIIITTLNNGQKVRKTYVLKV